MRDGSKEQRVDVSFGEQSVVLRRSGSSKTVVANILGRETNPATGAVTVWLDRRVHRAGEHNFHEADKTWRVSGAISTVLTKH